MWNEISFEIAYWSKIGSECVMECEIECVKEHEIESQTGYKAKSVPKCVFEFQFQLWKWKWN